jgi:serine/threonine protein phosphatase PrpC
VSAPLPKSVHSLRWNSYAISNTGRVRRHNEDSVLDRPDAGLWVVADGMGGHAKGDVASQMIVESLKNVQLTSGLSQFIDDIEDRILTVNSNLVEKARESVKKVTIGSTLVMMVCYDKYCVYIWTGDSRLYRLRDKQLRQITTDHSQVEQYIEQGLISRADALKHPHGNMITRAVGATEELFLDMDMQEMAKGDRYLLCSDGLTKHIPDAEIEQFLARGNPEECCTQLVNTTLERGAVDNVTVIIIDIE